MRNKNRSKSPSQVGPPPGLRKIVQNRFLKDVFQSAAEKAPGWKVLIVDTHSMRVISSAIGMYDIMERRVAVVESLEKKRAPFPGMDAVYVIQPTAESVALLVQDYVKGTSLYGKNVFLYFLGRVADELISEIKSCPGLVKRVRCFSEINVDFLVKEERSFTFDMRDHFPMFYNRMNGTPTEILVAERLVTVCGTLNEYPHIRYNYKSAPAQSLANSFHMKMSNFITQNSEWWYHGGPNKGQGNKGERATLLILDRADDCLSPLMHEFTYECLVRDLLTMEGDKITYIEDIQGEGGITKKQPKDVLLDEKDTIWIELRGKHVAEVSQILSKRIRDIMNSSAGSVLSHQKDNSNLSMSEMASALKALPEYQEILSKLGQHLSLSQDCMTKIVRKNRQDVNLMDVAELEQTMATGKNSDERTPKLADTIDSLEETLTKIDEPSDRVRLLLIATVALGGLRNQDRRRLLNCAELGDDAKAIEALQTFGVPLVNHDDKNRQLGPFHPKALAPDDPDSEYQSSRYSPLLKSILDDVCNRSLSLTDYPSVLPMPDEGAGSKTQKKKGGSAANPGASVRKQTASTSRWAAGANKKSGGPALSGPRIIVFIIGGASFAELRVCRDITENEGREVIVGSTAFISAKDFMADLSKLTGEESKSDG